MPDLQHQPQRSATRAPVERPVRLQFDDSIDVEEGLCGNVSIGGMFATVPSARPPGTLVRFELLLDDEESIRGLGEVIWMKPAPAGGDGGMGIKFRFLEQRDRQMIFRLVSQHIKERLAGSSAPATAPMPPPDEDLAGEPLAPPSGDAPDDGDDGGSADAGSGDDDDLLPIVPPPELPDIPPPVAAEPEVPQPEAPWSVIDPEIASGPETPVPEIPSEPAGEVGGALDVDLEIGRDAGLGEVAIDDFAGAGDPPEVPEVDGGDRIARSAGELALGAGYRPTEPDGDPGPEPEAEPVRPPDPYSRTARLRRTRPELSWPLVLVALVALGAAAYLFRARLFSGLDPPAPEGVPAIALPEEGADETGDGIGDGTDSAAAAAVSEREARPPAVEPPPPAVEPSPPPAVGPLPPSPSAQSAPPAAVPAAPPPGGSFDRLVDIGWSLQDAGVRVAIATDGTVTPDRLTHFRLEGGSPREVIVLRGVAEPYGRSTIPVGSDIVSGIRTGFHRKAGGNELHVVIDLADPRARVTAIRNLGRRLEIDVGR